MIVVCRSFKKEGLEHGLISYSVIGHEAQMINRALAETTCLEAK